MKLAHVTIRTSRFAEEIGFYTTYAGLRVQRDMRTKGHNIVFLGDEEGGAQVEVIEKADADDSGNANLSVGFVAEDLDALRAVLLRDGLNPTEFVSPVPQVRFFFVTDPAGVSVQFM